MAEWSEVVAGALNLIREASGGDEVLGASEEAIAAMERRLGVRLPASYREFLRHAGGSAGEFFRGSSLALSDLPNNKDVANMICEQYDLPPCRAHDVVFMEHDAYIYYLMHAVEGDDDPVVYGFYEDSEELRSMELRFSEWLKSTAEGFFGG